ncbi:predicted protein [Chaetoceros tenuissimus]|uniref:Uncharacterized protein n=1 Tax=Chaetoceros tenuissimus TaxID=426638 RepID=A0AAD3CDW4_9STRA|nr:predicted protein [Chaetoceros tenuissimus]
MSMNEENRRKLSISSNVSLHRVKIIPSVNDRLFVTDASIKEEEDKLYIYASSTETFEDVNDEKSFSNIAEVERDLTEVVEGEMSTLKRQLEKEKEDEMSTLQRQLEQEKVDEISALKRELEKEKEEDRRHEDERMAELMRELKESRSEDMKSMFMFQVGMVVLGCVATGLAIYIHFTRARKASDSTNSLV